MSESVLKQGVEVNVGPFRDVDDLIVLIVLRWSGNGRATVFVDPSLKYAAPSLVELATNLAKKVRAAVKLLPKHKRKRIWRWRGTAVVHAFGKGPLLIAASHPTAKAYAKTVFRLPSNDSRDWSVSSILSQEKRDLIGQVAKDFGIRRRRKPRVKAPKQLPYGLLDT